MSLKFLASIILTILYASYVQYMMYIDDLNNKYPPTLSDYVGIYSIVVIPWAIYFIWLIIKPKKSSREKLVDEIKELKNLHLSKEDFKRAKKKILKNK